MDVHRVSVVVEGHMTRAVVQVWPVALDASAYCLVARVLDRTAQHAADLLVDGLAVKEVEDVPVVIAPAVRPEQTASGEVESTKMFLWMSSPVGRSFAA